MTTFVVGIIGFGYFTGNITNIISELMIHETQLSGKLDEVTNYMEYRKVPKQLQQQVATYFQYYWQQTPFAAEREILSMLTPHLFEDVCKHLADEVCHVCQCTAHQSTFCTQVLLKNPLFTTSGNTFMIDVLGILKPVCKYPDELVTTADEEASEMFFLRKGKLRVMSTEKEGTMLYMMRSPNSLGEGGLFGGKRKSTTIAADICDLFSLSGEEFKDALNKLPDQGARIQKMVALDREIKSMRRKEASIDARRDGANNKKEKATLVIQKWLVLVKIHILDKQRSALIYRPHDITDNLPHAHTQSVQHGE